MAKESNRRGGSRPDPRRGQGSTVRLVAPVDRNQLAFLGLDQNVARDAQAVWTLIAPHLSSVLDAFSARLREYGGSALAPAGFLEALKRKQAEHLRLLFSALFDLDYANSARRIGIRHREIGIDPQWFISSYMALKIQFADVVASSSADIGEIRRLIGTLDKLIAIDMGLVMSAYSASVLD